NGLSNGNTPFTRNYTNNPPVTLTAPPAVGINGFLKWQRDGIDLTTNLTTTVTMDTNHTLTAVYNARDDAVGWWKFDDGSGPIALDSSAYGNHGSLSNGPIYTSMGHIEGGLIFDGVNDSVVVPSTSLLEFAGRNFTVALWVKTSKSGPQTLIEKQY